MVGGDIIFNVYDIKNILQNGVNDFNEVTLPDVYYMPEFIKLCEISGAGKGKMAIFKSESSLWIYPFLKQNIGRGVDFIEKDFMGNDIFSPYGYSGPINLKRKRENDRENFKEFRSLLKNYFEDKVIISEFIRFHPLLQTHKYFNKDDLKKTGKVVYFDLTKSKECLEEDMDNSTQRNIKKAKRNNLDLNFDFDLSTLGLFRTIYKKTMDRVNADSSYYFSEEYFTYLRKGLDENSFIVNVNKGSKTIASALFFFNDEIIQYHLGGSLSDYLKFRPNDLLFYEVAMWGKDNNYKYFNLGGGVGGKEDSLFRFKKSFSENTASFYTGRKIINKDRYEYLKNKWLNEYNYSSTEDIDYFPIYRKR